MARIPTRGPRPTPKGKFVEMNEEIPGLDWTGLLMKGIKILFLVGLFLEMNKNLVLTTVLNYVFTSFLRKKMKFATFKVSISRSSRS